MTRSLTSLVVVLVLSGCESMERERRQREATLAAMSPQERAIEAAQHDYNASVSVCQTNASFRQVGANFSQGAQDPNAPDPKLAVCMEHARTNLEIDLARAKLLSGQRPPPPPAAPGAPDNQQ